MPKSPKTYLTRVLLADGNVFLNYSLLSFSDEGVFIASDANQINAGEANTEPPCVNAGFPNFTTSQGTWKCLSPCGDWEALALNFGPCNGRAAGRCL